MTIGPADHILSGPPSSTLRSSFALACCACFHRSPTACMATTPAQNVQRHRSCRSPSRTRRVQDQRQPAHLLMALLHLRPPGILHHAAWSPGQARLPPQAARAAGPLRDAAASDGSIARSAPLDLSAPPPEGATYGLPTRPATCRTAPCALAGIGQQTGSNRRRYGPEFASPAGRFVAAERADSAPLLTVHPQSVTISCIGSDSWPAQYRPEGRPRTRGHRGLMSHQPGDCERPSRRPAAVSAPRGR
jgi:hypothetical protein